MNLKGLLTDKIGPLPGWAWLAIVAGGLFLWSSTHPSAPEGGASGSGGQSSGDYAPAELGGLPPAYNPWTPGGGCPPADVLSGDDYRVMPPWCERPGRWQRKKRLNLIPLGA